MAVQSYRSIAGLLVIYRHEARTRLRASPTARVQRPVLGNYWIRICCASVLSAPARPYVPNHPEREGVQSTAAPDCAPGRDLDLRRIDEQVPGHAHGCARNSTIAGVLQVAARCRESRKAINQICAGSGPFSLLGALPRLCSWLPPEGTAVSLQREVSRFLASYEVRTDGGGRVQR
jgi:hypothetical protein